MKSCLVILPTAIGDAICATPAVYMLRRRYPQAAITVCCAQSLLPLIADWHGCDQAVAYDNVGGGEADEFDWLIDLASTTDSFALHNLLTAQNVTKHAPEPDRYLINDCLRLPQENSPEFRGFSENPHQPAWLLEGAFMAAILGENVCTWLQQGFEPDLAFITPHEIVLGRAGLTVRNKVVLAPCGTKGSRRWPESFWCELLGKLESAGETVAIVLGPGEMNDYPELLRLADGNVLSNIDTRTMAALFAESKLVIANDCGPAHVAAAVGANILAIFGPTNPRCWFTYSGNHRQYIQKGAPANPLGILHGIEEWTAWPTVDEIILRVSKMLI